MICPECSAAIADESRFCSSCGRAVDHLSTQATRERAPSRESTASSFERPRDRFLPGKILASRYRIIDRVGTGGMGVVYHAEDLMLDQSVALKFLPEDLSRNREVLQRFRGEVRVARQISHPNVCRVYDIVEVEGHRFLTMEYIDGEDLRSLLRRIGRLPPNKALEIAGQLASGLAAAHDKGILHRDMKPANVMIDEQGNARIMDFGLAAAAEEIETRDIRSGTPGYMAPEQWRGEAVTAGSDIYSLGLVLYELFTGQRAFDAGGEQETPPKPPSTLVEDLDRAVDAVILQCLEREPHKRPPSAAAVRTALPVRDPLSAAVARGETPARAIVAEAGAFTGLSPVVAWTGLIGVLVSLAVTIWIGGQSRLSQIVPLPRSPEVLIADARAVLENLGYRTPQRDSTYGFARDSSYIDDLMSKERSSNWWELLARGDPGVIRFWYRESPQSLVPYRITEFHPTQHDPPLSVRGMVNLQLDIQGRLRQLEAVPVGFHDFSEDSAEVDWTSLFTAAGLHLDDFSPVEPRRPTSAYADHRAAWEGIYPDAPEIPIRIEAASYRGGPVAFHIIEPWTEPAEGGTGGSPWVRSADVVTRDWARLAHMGLHVVFMVVLALLARRNLRLGRGDRKLAFHLAGFFFTMVILQWIFGAHHVPEGSQLEIFFGALYRAFFAFGLAWLFYIALEPYARRLWPRSMISWIRLLEGRIRDPLVGRDVLMGCVYGIVGGLILQMPRVAPSWLGYAPPRPDLPRHPAELIALLGVNASLSELFAIQVNTLTYVLFSIVGLLLLRLIFRRTWIAVIIHWGLYVFVFASAWPWGFVTLPVFGVLWYVFFFRFGWVSIAVGTFTADLLTGFPLTTDLSAWYRQAPILAALVCTALATYGFKVSLAGRPVFKDLLAED